MHDHIESLDIAEAPRHSTESSDHVDSSRGNKVSPRVSFNEEVECRAANHSIHEADETPVKSGAASEEEFDFGPEDDALEATIEERRQCDMRSAVSLKAYRASMIRFAGSKRASPPSPPLSVLEQDLPEDYDMPLASLRKSMQSIVSTPPTSQTSENSIHRTFEQETLHQLMMQNQQLINFLINTPRGSPDLTPSSQLLAMPSSPVPRSPVSSVTSSSKHVRQSQAAVAPPRPTNVRRNASYGMRRSVFLEPVDDSSHKRRFSVADMSRIKVTV